MGLLYTIGHSQHDFEYFSNLLKNNNPCLNCESKECEEYCIRNSFLNSVNIKQINTKL